MSSNLPTTTSPPRTGWARILLWSVIGGWGLLIVFAWNKYGDWDKIALLLGPYGAAAIGLLTFQSKFKEEEGGSGKRFGHNMLHWVHLLGIGYGLTMYYPVSAEKMLGKISEQVKDNMNVQKEKMSKTAKYKDCPAIRRTFKDYQRRLTDSLLLENGIQVKLLPTWRKQVDSVVGDQTPATCQVAGWQQHFLEEVRSLAERKAVDEIDALMQRFGITANARALEQANEALFRYGTIRNYLLRIVQGIQPMFIDAEPRFNDQFSSISEIVFIVNLDT